MRYLLTAVATCAVLATSCVTATPSNNANISNVGNGTGTGRLAKQMTASGSALPAMPGVTVEDVAYYTNNGKAVNGYLARPSAAGDYPALVMVHEWWGLNRDMHELAQEYAARGYTVLAVDMYEGEVATTQEQAQKLSGAVRGNTADAMKNLTAAVTYLKSRPEVQKDRIASIGWCFGGGWAYEMAKNDLGVKATVMYYGRFMPEDDLSMMKSHIIGHFGEKDMSIKVDDVKQFQATLKKNSDKHEVYIYPNAGHGFANESNDNYQRQSAMEAQERTLDFLKREL